jgi:hypothetical protein
LTVVRSGSPPDDIQTLDRLHALLPQDGPDSYEIFLTAGSKSVRISNRTRYSQELEEALIALLGPGAVQVSEPTPA